MILSLSVSFFFVRLWHGSVSAALNYFLMVDSLFCLSSFTTMLLGIFISLTCFLSLSVYTSLFEIPMHPLSQDKEEFKLQQRCQMKKVPSKVLDLYAWSISVQVALAWASLNYWTCSTDLCTDAEDLVCLLFWFSRTLAAFLVS